MEMASEMSPRKKKMKLAEPVNSSKRACEVAQSSKRVKVESGPSSLDVSGPTVDLKARRRLNFVKACERVSYKAYFDHRTRLQLVYLPACTDGGICKHHDHKDGTKVREIPSFAEESMKIEMKNNMWREALEVCTMCITADQYLSANVLKDIVEIMLNAQEDYDSGESIEELIDQCQQILSLNFSTHPPCLIKSLRKCYNDFLSSPMKPKDETFTNRDEFDCNKGIVKYCLNRLQYEISLESKDGPLIDKYEHIPEDMKDSVKGLYWQKQKFEIYELLERPARIQRLMAILESIIELLQFDLVIWHSRYTHNLGCHIMRSSKPLMAFILWSNNVLYTGAVNNNCRQILRLCVYMIHLRYPEEHINIMMTWLNVIIQTFYVCETNSNGDYPNTGKYCAAFAKEFYKIIAEMPYESITRILERIQPTFMQQLIGTIHIKTLLSTQEDDVIKIFIDFLDKSQWKMFPEDDSGSEIKITKIPSIKPRKLDILNFFAKKCTINAVFGSDMDCDDVDDYVYQKFDPHIFSLDCNVEQNYIVHILYITVEAYLDAYNVQLFQETLDNLNAQIENGNSEMQNEHEYGSYSVTEHFIKKYRSMFQLLQQLTVLLQEMKSSQNLPGNIRIFANLGLLE